MWGASRGGGGEDLQWSLGKSVQATAARFGEAFSWYRKSWLFAFSKDKGLAETPRGWSGAPAPTTPHGAPQKQTEGERTVVQVRKMGSNVGAHALAEALKRILTRRILRSEKK
eukprot:jgi/Botrbrau1/15911/Bobra.40_1s0093.1